MNDGHILVIILAAFVVAQTIAFGIYKHLKASAMLLTALADEKTADIVSKLQPNPPTAKLHEQ